MGRGEGHVAGAGASRPRVPRPGLPDIVPDRGESSQGWTRAGIMTLDILFRQPGAGGIDLIRRAVRKGNGVSIHDFARNWIQLRAWRLPPVTRRHGRRLCQSATWRKGRGCPACVRRRDLTL